MTCLKITSYGQSAAKLLSHKIRGTFNDYPAREYIQVDGNGNKVMQNKTLRYSLVCTEMCSSPYRTGAALRTALNITKGHSTNIIEEQLLHHFREIFFTDVYPIISTESLHTIATKRAVIKNEDEEIMLTAVKKEFEELGKLAFSFDSGTPAAIKQMRHKLLMANIGSVNLEIDEIGSNLIGNGEALTTFLELFDVGKIKQKLTKNTKENVRSEEIDGRTPTNLLMFGTPSKLFDGSKVENEFYSFLDIGYARRCLFGYSKHAQKNKAITPEEIYDALTDSSVEQFMQDTAISIGKLANITNHNKVISVSKKVSILVIEYRLYCEQIAEQLGEHQEIAKAEVSHRYFKALKLAGVYAFIDGDHEITEDNYYHAICMVEESGRAFDKILSRDRPYVKLAKYIGSIGKEITHADLAEDLPFYRGSMAAKQEQLQLAAAWGHKNSIVIKKSMVSGIEFLKGETLEKSNLNSLQLAFSHDIANGYRNVLVDWKDLHKLVNEPYKHWINHHSLNGNRSEDNMVPGFSMVILDIDNGSTIKECAMLLKDYKFLIYTTKRHTAQNNRFRLILPINYNLKLNADDYRSFMRSIFDWLPIEIDSQTVDRCRKWLTCDSAYQYNEGTQLLDARLFIPKTSKSDEQKTFIATYQSMTNMERWFLTNSGTGNRNNQLVRYALMQVDLGYDKNNIRDNVMTMNNKFPDKLTIKEIDSTIMVSVHRKMQKQNRI